VRPISETLRRKLTESHRSTARLAVLDPVSFELVALLSGETGYVVAGSVAMSRSRAIRRTCDITLANPDGALTPTDAGSLFWVNALVRLDRGVYVDDQTVEWCTLGHFLLGRPTVQVDAGGSTLQVQGEDRAKLLVRSRFVTPTSYAAGTRIASVIQTEAQTAGMGATRYRLDDATKTLTRERVFEEGESRIDALVDLARDYGLELYVDADGYLALSTPPDALTAPIVWEYASRDDAVHVGITRELTDDRLYNHVIVTGESSDPAHPPVRGEALDSNAASPTYVGGPLGDRVYRYTSAMITSTAQAEEVAQQLLARVALLTEAIELPQVVNPALEPGDAVSISEELSATSGRYLIEQLQTPLGLGQQQLSTQLVRSLG
jgi:hypothetical protein